MFVVEHRSRLRASADEVWAHARFMEGVNAELAPWVRMGIPAHARGRPLEDAPRGREALRSVLFALGVVPFDVHHLVLIDVHERGFVEESWSWMERRWRHERDVTPCADGGCEVHDRVTVEARARLAEPVARRIVDALFRRRHRVLRRLFGA